MTTGTDYNKMKELYVQTRDGVILKGCDKDMVITSAYGHFTSAYVNCTAARNGLGGSGYQATLAVSCPDDELFTAN